MGNGGGGEEGKEGVGDGPGGMHDGELLLEGELCCCGLLEMNFGLPKVQESLLDEVSKFGLFSRWLESLGWLRECCSSGGMVEKKKGQTRGRRRERLF